MDPSSLVVAVAAAAIVWFGPRLMVQSLGRAGDGMAQLFVPPDRGLGWPRGVQESDEPWAWRAVTAPSTPDGGTDDDPRRALEPVLIELVDHSFDDGAVHDALVVRVGSVHRGRVG